MLMLKVGGLAFMMIYFEAQIVTLQRCYSDVTDNAFVWQTMFVIHTLDSNCCNETKTTVLLYTAKGLNFQQFERMFK